MLINYYNNEMRAVLNGLNKHKQHSLNIPIYIHIYIYYWFYGHMYNLHTKRLHDTLLTTITLGDECFCRISSVLVSERLMNTESWFRLYAPGLHMHAFSFTVLNSCGSNWNSDTVGPAHEKVFPGDVWRVWLDGVALLGMSLSLFDLERKNKSRRNGLLKCICS